MGWPKKNERLRLYFERKPKSYLLYDPETQEGIAELLIDNDPNDPTLCTTTVSPIYLYQKCRRASWNDLPKVWRDAFKGYLVDEPEDYRGLWRMNEQKIGNDR